MTKTTSDAWADLTFDYLEAQGFRPFNLSLLLAVSGGVDSMVLLQFWNTAGRKRYNCSIAAAHIDHGLRKSSREDRLLVQSTCKKWSIPFHCRRLTPSGRKPRVSPEMWGREERYRYFSSLVAANKYSRVLTAHHLDDQVETLFLRLERGTGLQGLQGIWFFRRPNIIRPFLNRTRSQLQAYAEEHRIPWNEDSTNKDLRIKRNWFRWNYLPDYKGKHPGVLDSVHRLTENAQRIWPGIEKWLGGAIKRDLGDIPYLSARPMREKLGKGEGGVFETLSILAERSGTEFSESHFSELLRQLKSGAREIGVKSNNEFMLKMDKSRIWFERIKLEKNVKNSKYSEIKLDISRKKTQFKGKWGEKEIIIQTLRYPKNSGFHLTRQKGQKAFLDGDKFSSTLIIRTRKKGDKFSPLGTPSRSRKLKTFLNGIKLPAYQRDRYMLVCCEDEVVWLPSLEISDFYKITDTTKQILELEIKCQS